MDPQSVDTIRPSNLSFVDQEMFNISLVLSFQVTATEVLPASMFIPVPGPEAQSTPQATANSSADETKKLNGQ